MNETLSVVALSGTEMENLPSPLAVVPMLVPATRMLAPTSDSLLSLPVTLPVTTRCAKTICSEKSHAAMTGR